MGGGDYDVGVVIVTQLAQARDRLTAHITEAVKRELDEVQYRLVIDIGCALERALQGQESSELEELRTEIAELRAEIARGTNGRLLQLENGKGGMHNSSFALPEERQGAGEVDEAHAALKQAEEEEKLMWKRAVEESDRRKAAQKAAPTPEPLHTEEEPPAALPEAPAEVPESPVAPEPLTEAGSEPQVAESEPQAAASAGRVAADEEPTPTAVPEPQMAAQQEEPEPRVAESLPAEQPEPGPEAVPEERQLDPGKGQEDEPEAAARQPQESSQSQGREQAGAEATGLHSRGESAGPPPQSSELHKGEPPPQAKQPAAEPAQGPKAAKTTAAPAHAATATPARAQAELLEAKRRAEVAGAVSKPKTSDEPKLSASELKAKCKPYLHDQEWTDGRLWIVVGGEDTGGIVVRKDQSLTSERYPFRLSRGTTVEELELVGNRLHYKRIRGDGPDWGWVNVMHRDKALVELDSEPK